MITGILPVDKALGWTSHDVVARVRRLAGQREVGHAGTLDPLATGVLLVVLGGATKLSSYLMEGTKVYRAEVVLGTSTATDDSEAPAGPLRSVDGVGRDQIEMALQTFVGTFDQVPPAYAAVRQNGKKLYQLARQGSQVVPEPRRVTIHEIVVEAWAAPRLTLRIRCAAGTYIRSLARDIGVALGVQGYLHALRRLQSGTFEVENCHLLDRLNAVGDLSPYLQPLDRAVAHLPAVAVSSDEVQRLRDGRPVQLQGAATGTVRLYGPQAEFVALGEVQGTQVKPFRVFRSEG